LLTFANCTLIPLQTNIKSVLNCKNCCGIAAPTLRADRHCVILIFCIRKSRTLDEISTGFEMFTTLLHILVASDGSFAAREARQNSCEMISTYGYIVWAQ
jgi:hypothetical protein